MCHTFYGFAPGDFTEIENLFDVGVHEYSSKVCQEKCTEKNLQLSHKLKVHNQKIHTFWSMGR